ncbi:MAG: hypothetical protein ABMB14_34335 [Myxococcota bacterium]
MRRFVVVAALVLLAGPALAKPRGKKAPAEAPTVTAPAAPVAEPTADATAEPALPTDPLALASELGLSMTGRTQLIDAGAGSRAVLGYHPRPGAVATYQTVARSKLDLAMSMAGQPFPVPSDAAGVPTVTTVHRHTVAEPRPNGFSVVRIEQTDASVEGGDAATLAELQRLNGLALDLLVDPSGKPVQVDVSGADPAAVDLLQQIGDRLVGAMSLFPAEPVGVGARWRIDAQIEMAGMKLDLVELVTARSITATTVDLDLALTMELVDGAVVFPGMPPGMTPQVTKFSGTGGGASHVNLDTLVATGTTAIDLAMGMKIDGPLPMDMSFAVHQVTDITPVD